MLRAALVDRRPRGARDLGTLTESAARLLGVYLSDLDEVNGREFKDPGFLAWNLADYARDIGERGLLAPRDASSTATFGMKAPPAFASEPAGTDGLFDFSSTTGDPDHGRAVGRGGDALRGRLAARAGGRRLAPGWSPGRMDENTWNACAAAAMGRAFVISTDERFFDAHQAIMTGLESRLEEGALGRAPGFSADTSATFYYALAVDALVKV